MWHSQSDKPRTWDSVQENGPSQTHRGENHHQVRHTTLVMSEKVEWRYAQEMRFLKVSGHSSCCETVFHLMSDAVLAKLTWKCALTGWWELAIIWQRITIQCACNPCIYRVLFRYVLFETTLTVCFIDAVSTGLHNSLKPQRNWENQSLYTVPWLQVLCYSLVCCQSITNGWPVQLSMEMILS